MPFEGVWWWLILQCFISFSFLKDIFDRYRNLAWHLFSFSIFKVLFSLFYGFCCCSWEVSSSLPVLKTWLFLWHLLSVVCYSFLMINMDFFLFCLGFADFFETGLMYFITSAKFSSHWVWSYMLALLRYYSIFYIFNASSTIFIIFPVLRFE